MHVCTANFASQFKALHYQKKKGILAFSWSLSIRLGVRACRAFLRLFFLVGGDFRLLRLFFLEAVGPIGDVVARGVMLISPWMESSLLCSCCGLEVSQHQT